MSDVVVTLLNDVIIIAAPRNALQTNFITSPPWRKEVDHKDKNVLILPILRP